MAKTILEEFELLWADRAATEKMIADCYETQDHDPGIQAFWDRYYQEVNSLRSAWGEPVYEGVGPRAGYEGPGPGSISINSALRFAWWHTDKGDAAIMMTGHDADTLLILWINIAPHQGQ